MIMNMNISVFNVDFEHIDVIIHVYYKHIDVEHRL